jgi:predicted esterase
MTPLIGALSTQGSQIVDATGTPVRIASIGNNQVFGNLGPDHEAMAAAGFNCTRVSWVNSTRDSDLARIDGVVSAAKAAGMRVILDCHTNDGTGPQQTNGLWYGQGGTTDASFLADWVVVAGHYASEPTVVGFDIRNEPTNYGVGAAWGPDNGADKDLHAMYTRVGTAIQAVNPGALIIAEGSQDYNQGAPMGDLRAVRQLPLVLPIANKVVYSIHDYPQTIGGVVVTNAQRQAVWGWLVSEGIAPVWVGECGADMANATETAWAADLVTFCNGGFAGGPTVSGAQQGIGTDWWAWGNLDGQQPNGTLDSGGGLRAEQQAVYSNFAMSAVVTPPIVAPPPVQAAQPGTWLDGNIGGMAYKVLLPDGYPPGASAVLFPVVFYLHQLDMGTDVPDLMAQINPWFNNPTFRAAHPAIVVVPLLDQSADPSGNTVNFGGVSANVTAGRDTALQTLAQVLGTYNCDPTRLYVTGNSLGGIGTWEMIAFKPTLFAAAMPLAGASYARDVNTVSVALRTKPIWAIHGALDTSVPLDWDRAVYVEMRAIGGVMKYAELSGVGHDVWDTVYPDPQYFDWLFKQRMGAATMPTMRPSTEGTTVTRPSDPAIIDATGAVWTLTTQAQCAVNGIVDTTTANVVKIVYSVGAVYQTNVAGGWWSKVTPAGAWLAASPPVVVAPPVVVKPPVVTHATLQAQLDQVLAILAGIRVGLTSLTP